MDAKNVTGIWRVVDRPQSLGGVAAALTVIIACTICAICHRQG